MKWETGILSPPSSSYISSNWMIEDSVKTTIWTPAENKLFENALAKFDNNTPDLWQRVAEMVPGKTVADVIQQYKELEDDVRSIEAGFYPKHRYNCSNSNFVLEWGNNCEFDEFKTAYGGRGKRSAAVAAVPVALVAAGRPLEQERKKGIPWTEEEHKLFLLGLKKYGKGDWRNISRNFVVTRTPTQVASHAQKYFIRQLSGGKDKRRASIHDITTVNLNESNHISSPDNKTTISPEQRHFLWSQSNAESTIMDFNQTHVDFFMSNTYGGGDDGGGGGCGDDGLHQSYGAPNNMIFEIQPTYPL